MPPLLRKFIKSSHKQRRQALALLFSSVFYYHTHLFGVASIPRLSVYLIVLKGQINSLKWCKGRMVPYDGLLP